MACASCEISGSNARGFRRPKNLLFAGFPIFRVRERNVGRTGTPREEESAGFHAKGLKPRERDAVLISGPELNAANSYAHITR